VRSWSSCQKVGHPAKGLVTLPKGQSWIAALPWKVGVDGRDSSTPCLRATGKLKGPWDSMMMGIQLCPLVFEIE